jgi:hypothetical protein
MFYIKLKEEDKYNEKKINKENRYANFYKPRNSSHDSNLKFYIVLSLVLFMLITLISVNVSLSYRNNLFKTNQYWTELSALKSQNSNIYFNKTCVQNTSNLNTFELNRFMDYLNGQYYFNYFVCFSSLYFMVKIEEYKPYRNSFYDKKRLMFPNSNSKCIMTENMNDQINIHMCYLKESKFNICGFVNRYNKKYFTKINCDYNYFNGEYSIYIDDHVKLTYHEFKMKFKNIFSILQYNLNTKVYGLHSPLQYDKYIDDYASLNNGLLTNLFDTQYYSIPLYMFYTRQSKIIDNYINLNYANSTFRMPSDIVNYFMIFYSKIWFK